MAEADSDQDRAAHQTEAREWLLDAGAAALPRAPWLHDNQPPPAADLIQFALWRTRAGDVDQDELAAALALLPVARVEVDQLEAALLFSARANGLSWARISQAMGLGSAQAAQQRFERVAGRVEALDGGDMVHRGIPSGADV